jgi:hypothetical protein
MKTKLKFVCDVLVFLKNRIILPEIENAVFEGTVPGTG